MEKCVYWFYDIFFLLLPTCALSWILRLLLAELRGHGKENNVSDSDKNSVLDKKCLHVQSPCFCAKNIR